MPEKEIRKLAAVMFTDIAGYTAMVQEDEAAALLKVSRYRKVLQDCTSHYEGQVIAFYGDGSLSIYPSAIHATRCAIDMQAMYRQDNPVPVRIGLHLGDIVLKDETVYGDGVNVASRIEAQGVPGAILISGNMYHEVINKSDIHTTHLGAYELKNVKERVDIHAITNEGLVVPPKPKHRRYSSRMIMQFATVGALLLVVGYYLFDSGILPNQDNTTFREERVAVLFTDFILTESLKFIPEMAGRLLTDELLEIPNAKIISYESVIRGVGQGKNNGSGKVLLASADYAKFATNTGAVNVLDGMVIETDNGDSLEFRASLRNLAMDTLIKRFTPVKCSVKNAPNGIIRLGSAILGWWASREDKVLTVPNIEAYKAYLKARKAWKTTSDFYIEVSDDDDVALQHLQKSIALDSSFMDPYFLMMDFYINEGDLAAAQNIVNLVERRFDDLTKRQKNLLNYYKADINGENQKAFELYEDELAIDPKDHFVNTSAMVLAARYVHNAKKVLEYFELIPIDSLDLDDCAYCVLRSRLAIDAYVQQGELDRARELAEKIPLSGAHELISRITVYTQLNDTVALKNLISEVIEGPFADNRWVPYYRTAERFKILDNEQQTKYYAQKALEVHTDTTGWNHMLIKYMLGDYEGALKLLTPFIKDEKDKTNPIVQLYAGLVHAKLNNRTQARLAIEELEKTQPLFVSTELLYYKASIYAQLGDFDAAIDQLEVALNAGMMYAYWAFENDPHMNVLRNNPRYQALVYPAIE